MKYINSHTVINLCFLLLVLLGTGCYSGCPECGEAIESIDEKVFEYEDLSNHKLIREFHAQTIGGREASIVDTIDFYIDRSATMSHPFLSNPKAETVFSNLYQSVDAQNLNCFGLDANKRESLYKFDKDDMTLIFDSSPAAFYRGKSSPLEPVLTRMCKQENRQSIFVTDGEITGGKKVGAIPSAEKPWAARSFKDWLAGGNDIDLIVIPFKDKWHSKKDSMRLFFIFLTPQELVGNPSNAVQKFLLTSQEYKDSYTHLHIASNPIFLTQENHLEASEENIGINTFLSELIYVENREKGTGFTHLDLSGNKDIFEDFMRSLKEGDFQADYRELPEIRKMEKGCLFFDQWLTNQSLGYSEIELGVKVYDLTQPIEAFINTKECQAAIKADGEEGKPVWCIDRMGTCQSGKPVCDTSSFFPSEKDLRSQLLSIDEEKYSSTDGQRRAHVAVRPHTNYNELLLSEASHLRVDIVLEGMIYKEEPQMQILKWPDRRGATGKNVCMYASVKDAMIEHSTNQKNKILYTYYLTF